MSLVFTETLRGSYFLVDAPDDARLCEVAITVKMARPRSLAEQVDAEMTGTATFDQIAGAVPIQGELKLKLTRPRRVAYEFSFQAEDGRTLRFAGAKHPSLMRPLYSATTLWGSLFDGERAVAMVRLHFDLRRDLVAFLQSVSRPPNQPE